MMLILVSFRYRLWLTGMVMPFLEFHVVHGGTVAATHLFDLVDLACIKENALGGGRLTRVDVGGDADIAILGEVLPWSYLLKRRL